MNSPFNQQDRQGRLSTSLGDTALVLLRMDGTEELSGDFEWQVEALSEQSGLDLEALLGTHATVEIDHPQGIRAFDGIVCEAVHRGPQENGWRYDLVLRPWLHVASLHRNMRIFHNKTAIQIIEEVLVAYAGLGKPHLDVQTTGDYPVLEYTVQYGESDADFVCRQMERHGITWSWRHEAASHTLLLTDAVFSLPNVPGGSRPYYGVDGFNQQEEEHFKVWSSAERITTGAVRLTEYNFKTPNAAQEVNRIGDATHPNGDVESYDWPGDYLDQGQGHVVAARRVAEERGHAPRHRAEGDVISLGAGWRVTLAGDDVQGATGRTFVCLRAEHHFRSQAYGTAVVGQDEKSYEGSYVLLPDDAAFRPERRLAGSKVQGPETAVVVGDGEIDSDEHGRILVRFHWDSKKANTMRVRVSQNWASKGWGGIVIPRIGMEVIVEHLRGDPDKPIVTGCVYNGKNTPPYELPANKTRSVFRTDSHAGKGFNELRFEDESGQEEIMLRAQKDLTQKVENNATLRVDANQFTSIGQNSLIEVAGQSTHHVGGDLTISVSGSNKETYATGRLGNNWEGTRQVGYLIGRGKAAMKGVGNFMMNAVGTIYMTAQKNILVDSGGDIAISSGNDRTDTVARDRVDQTRRNSNSSVGKTQRIEVGKNLKVTVGQEIEFRCGSSLIHAKSDGTINIEGGHITINGSRIDLN